MSSAFLSSSHNDGSAGACVARNGYRKVERHPVALPAPLLHEAPIVYLNIMVHSYKIRENPLILHMESNNLILPGRKS